MPSGAFSAARKLAIDDAFLVAGVGSIDFKDLRDQVGPDFRPQGIQIDLSSNAAQETAGYCTVIGILYGENDDMVDTYRLHTRMAHGLAFRKIWANGTTGRGIKLLSEV